MPRRGSVARLFGALVVGALGTLGVVGLSLGMNLGVTPRAMEPVATITEVAVAKPARAAKNRPRRSTPSRRAARAAPSPAPMLSASLSGLDFGLGDAASASLEGATASLLDQGGGGVVDEDSVEVAPRPVERTAPSFPARARALGQTGWVTLSFVVDLDGSTADVAVVEAEPPGVFDEAAADAVRQWRFEPGEQGGAPVAVRVRQTLRFELE